MTPAEYRELVDRLVSQYPPEMAARLIERKCRPALSEQLKRDPVVVPERSSEGDGAA